jgi:hypothetical protein
MNDSKLTVVVIRDPFSVTMEKTAAGIAESICIFTVDCIVPNKEIFIPHAQGNTENKLNEEEDD